LHPIVEIEIIDAIFSNQQPHTYSARDRADDEVVLDVAFQTVLDDHEQDLHDDHEQVRVLPEHLAERELCDIHHEEHHDQAHEDDLRLPPQLPVPNTPIVRFLLLLLLLFLVLQRHEQIAQVNHVVESADYESDPAPRIAQIIEIRVSVLQLVLEDVEEHTTATAIRIRRRSQPASIP
jgi:hypothetical protein